MAFRVNTFRKWHRWQNLSHRCSTDATLKLSQTLRHADAASLLFTGFTAHTDTFRVLHKPKSGGSSNSVEDERQRPLSGGHALRAAVVVHGARHRYATSEANSPRRHLVLAIHAGDTPDIPRNYDCCRVSECEQRREGLQLGFSRFRCSRPLAGRNTPVSRTTRNRMSETHRVASSRKFR